MHLVLALVNVTLIACLGLDPNAVIVHAALVLVIDILHHTSLHLPERLDRLLQPFIMTPMLHHLHHSDHIAETDTNYGHDLAIWDRLFGTYITHSKRPDEAFGYGLTQFPEERADDLDKLLLAPFKGGSNS